MLLVLMNYGIALFLIIYAFWIRFKVSESFSSWVLFLFCFAGAISALGGAISYQALNAGSPVVGLFFQKVSASGASANFVLLFLLALVFPYEKHTKFLGWVALLLWLAASWLIFTGNNYLSDLIFDGEAIKRIPGKYYFLLSRGGFLLGAFSAILLLIRRSRFRSMIYRLQTTLIVIGIVLGLVLAYVLGVLFPEDFGASNYWLMLPLGWLVCTLVIGYSILITRLFDMKASVLRSLFFILYAGILGLISGGLYSIFNRLFGVTLALSGILAALVFIVVELASSSVRRRFGERLRSRGAYGERLDEALASLDYSKGRDYVIDYLMQSLKDNVGCDSVNLFIEDMNMMELVGSTNGKEEGFRRNLQGIDVLLNHDVSIILKTEIIANYEYHDVKGELLEIMEAYDSDAFILLREGRTITGVLMLGAKSSGSDFTDYDFSVFSKVYGKIFVIAYYLKNIAKESLVTTVDRELEFSEQIIQSIQENIDRIEHSAVDISYTTRSTRKLGGDFIDFIRLSTNRYIFVIGDVSGKGLNASMSMVILKSVIRTFLRETKDFKKLVVKVNAFIKANLPKGTFFAGVFGLFDFSEQTLYFVNCGVPVMFLLSSAYNNPVEIQGDGKVLGFLRDISAHINVRKVSFKPDDVLMITTDGLVDAESLRGLRYGKERVQENMMENRSLSAERMVQFLSESVEEFVSQELNDDITILAIKFLHKVTSKN